MSDDMTLFDLGAESEEPNEAPRCAMCARPAKWLARQAMWGDYCDGRSCPNRDRICQVCEGPFVRGINGAGTKFCSDECARERQARRCGSAGAESCCWCGKSWAARPRRAAARWPYVCAECTGPIHHLMERLRSHRVPHEMARRLLTDPTCEVCGVDIVAKHRDSTSGRNRALLVVDHDHRCCPGVTSCGECVRGLLCSNCNCAAGLVQDDPDIAQALVFYLVARSELGGSNAETTSSSRRAED